MVLWLEIVGVSLRCSWRSVGDCGGFLDQSESTVSFEFQTALLYYSGNYSGLASSTLCAGKLGLSMSTIYFCFYG